MDIIIFLLSLFSIWGALQSLDITLPIIGLSVFFTSIFYAIYSLKGRNPLTFLQLYILAIPLFAAYDRYFGFEYLNQTGYILRTGITQCVLILLLSGILVKSITQKKSILAWNTPVDYSLLMLLAYLLINFLNQANIELLIQQRFYGWIPYYLMVYIFSRSVVRDIESVTKIFVAIEISVCTVIVSRYFYQPPLAFLEGLYRIEVNYIYLSAVIYSQVLILVLPISYYLYKNAESHKSWYLMLLLLLASEIIFTQTRGAYIAALLSLGYYYVKVERVPVLLNKKNIFLMVVVIVLIVSAQFLLKLRELNQGGIEGSTVLRGLILAYYFNEFLLKFWFGWGYGSEGVKSIYNEGAHNSYLSLSYDLGIIGVIAFLFVLYATYRMTKNMINKYPTVKKEIVVMQACIISQLIFGMTTGNNIFYSIPMQIIFLLLIIVSLIPSLQNSFYGKNIVVVNK